MNIKIIKDDSKIMVDGEPLVFDYDLTDNIAAIQWDGSTGHIEFNDGTHNKTITDFSEYQYLVDAFNTEKQRVADEMAQKDADNIANYTYSHNRSLAYPSLTEQADMAYWDRQNGTTTLDDAITAVKDAYPKP